MAGYSNEGGGKLGDIPDLVSTPLLGGLEATAAPDYSKVLGNILAEKETMAKLKVASDTQKQVELLQAHQDADLAKTKADKAASEALRMQIEFESSPEEIAKYKAAAAARHSQAIVDAQTESKQQDDMLKQLREAGGNPADYYAGANEQGTTTYNWPAIAKDIPILQAKKGYAAMPQIGANGEVVPAPTSVEAANAPAPTGDLSEAPAPAAAAPASGAPVSLPPIQTSAGPVSNLSESPAPGTPAVAPMDTSASNVVPPALRVDPNFVPQMQQQYAIAARALQLENFKKSGFMVAPSQAEVFSKLGLKTEKEIFVDPQTQNSYEAQVTRDAAGRIWSAPSNPVLHERSKTQQTIDTEAAKDYQDYTQNQGVARDKNDIATLDSAIGILRDGKTTASGAFLNLLPQWVKNITLTEKGLKVPQMVQNVLISHLKEAFPGRVTNFDFQKSLELVFNPALQEKTNAETVERKRNELAAALEHKRDSMQYFGEHGTLAGYKSKSLADQPSGESTTRTSSSTGTLGETRYNAAGKAYTLTKDEVSGKLVWLAK